MSQYSPTLSNSNKKVALAAIILLGFADTFLSFLAYQGGLGKLKSLDIIWGPFFSVVTAIFLAIGLTLVEYLVNSHNARGIKVSELLKVVSVFLLISFAYINVGAGSFRLNENARQSQNAARLEVGNDPRWIALEKDLAAQHGMLKNGALGDDEAANKRIREIKAEMQALSDEYARNSNIINQASVSTVIEAMFGTYQFFILVFLVVTLAFGYSVQVFERQPEVSTGNVNLVDKKQSNVDNKVSTKSVNRTRQPVDKKASTYKGKNNLVDTDRNRKIIELCNQVTYDNGNPKHAEVARIVGCSRQYVSRVWREYNYH